MAIVLHLSPMRVTAIALSVEVSQGQAVLRPWHPSPVVPAGEGVLKGGYSGTNGAPGPGSPTQGACGGPWRGRGAPGLGGGPRWEAPYPRGGCQSPMTGPRSQSQSQGPMPGFWSAIFTASARVPRLAVRSPSLAPRSQGLGVRVPRLTVRESPAWVSESHAWLPMPGPGCQSSSLAPIAPAQLPGARAWVSGSHAWL